jgi:glycosyltransferase involved in cell wall biosynthesis
MKVVFVVGTGDYTGAAKMAHEYAKVGRSHGWDILFIVGDPPQSSCDKLADFLKKDSFNFVQEKGFTRLRSESLIRRVTKIIQLYNPSFILSTVQIDLKITGPASRRANKPILVFDQTIHYFFGLPFIRYLKKVFFGKEMQKAHAIIAVGEAVRMQAIKEFCCAPKNVYVVPNGIPVSSKEHFSRNLLSGRRSLLRGLNVGRIDAQKGQHLIIEALNALKGDNKNISFDFVGDVTPNCESSEIYKARCLSDIRTYNQVKYIRFLGWKSNIKMLLTKYDFYVHSALWEGFPIAVLEAMAASLPVIMTDCVGRLPGFCDGSHGWIVKKGDSIALADAIESMLNLDAKKRMRMGSNCRNLILERYDIKTTGSLFVSTCERVIQDFSNK